VPGARAPTVADVPDYDLPPQAIAQHPVEPRDAARLLVALGGALQHRIVRDLPELVGEGDVLVVNTSRVVPARLRLERAGGGAAEVLLLEPLPPVGPAPGPAGTVVDQGGEPTGRRLERGPGAAPEAKPERPGARWLALVRPGRRLAPGSVLCTGGHPVVEVGERTADGGRVVTSLVPDLLAYGRLALPPYIHAELYQTVYSDRPGSVAAPTAGLHLTPGVLEACRRRGVVVADVDLAVGLGTFRPIKTERVDEHAMHSERYRVPPATWDACHRARRVVAVGTTVVRTLESAAATGRLEGRTELFIRPGFEFQVVNALLTNFHQPRSSLLVLLEAFAGPRWRDLYALALSEAYRFLSFGDAMLLARGACR
jgi:S-adenosylmethionine:tRNA ribosyltransferase-isomerase